MKYNNVAIIMQPHFNTHCFRVDLSSQKGEGVNYIVVTCSPQYNGVWAWDKSNMANYSLWDNNGRVCICVPIANCKRVQDLSTIKDPTIISHIKRLQKKFLKISNYKGKPEWVL